MLIEPLPADNGCSMTLKQVETPTAYGGDSLGAQVLNLSGTYSGAAFPCLATCASTGQTFAIAAIEFSSWPSVPLYSNDQIQIGYQGFWYTVAPANCNAIQPGTTPNLALNSFNSSTQAVTPTQISVGNQQVPCLFVFLDISHGEQPVVLSSAIESEFKIRRWPTKTATNDLQLPSPTVVDLTWSGHDPIIATDPPTWQIQQSTSRGP